MIALRCVAVGDGLKEHLTSPRVLQLVVACRYRYAYQLEESDGVGLTCGGAGGPSNKLKLIMHVNSQHSLRLPDHKPLHIYIYIYSGTNPNFTFLK